MTNDITFHKAIHEALKAMVLILQNATSNVIKPWITSLVANKTPPLARSWGWTNPLSELSRSTRRSSPCTAL